MTAGRLALLLLVASLLIGFFALGGLHYLSLDYVKAQQHAGS